MTPVYQRIVDPKNGDCHRAAVASLLDLALDDVPEDLQEGRSMEDFLIARGMSALCLDSYHLRGEPNGYKGSEPWDARKFVRYNFAAGALALASVPSQIYLDGWHAIVVGFVLHPEGWVQCKCVHDPNPRNKPYDMQNTKVRSLTFFLPRWDRRSADV